MPDYPRVPLHPQGFDPTRSFDTTFAGYPAAHHASHPSGPVPTYSAQMTPLNYGGHTRAAYDGQAAYLDYAAPPPPANLRVHTYSPTRGRPGTTITATVTAPWDIMANSNSASLQYQYGGRQRKSPATMTRDSSQDDRQYHYLLSSQVPHLPDISEWVSEVPIMLVIDSPTGEEYSTEVGNFTYEPEFGTREPVRMEAEDIRQGLRSSNMDIRNSVTDYQQYDQGYPYRHQYTMSASYDSLPAQSHMAQQLSAPPMQQHNSQPLMPWTSNRNNSISARHLPNITPNPKLVRTSTLDAFRTPLGHSSAGTGAYYHQAMKPPPVILRFESNLEEIGRSDRWPQEQARFGRRVVYFRREQRGAEILLKFHVAKPDEIGGGGSNRPQASIPLSCILWDRKKTCFVTSVDTIALLEFIMDQKFPTEEKNRIRRNLEHFKPVTVKKPIPGSHQPSQGHGNEDTNDLFTTIMAFGAPKPRNIEKDIKVFKWSNLKNALLKITSKYSIKPGPSLPPPPQHPLPTPASSTGTSSGYSIDNTGLYMPNDRSSTSGLPFSPRTTSRPLPSYAPASFANPHSNSNSSSIQRLHSPPPYNRASLSLRGLNDIHHHPPHLQSYDHQHQGGGGGGGQQWTTSPTHHMPVPMPPQNTYGTPRPSWELGMPMPGALAFEGAAAGSQEGMGQQQQLPSPRTALPDRQGEGNGSGNGSGNGMLRH